LLTAMLAPAAGLPAPAPPPPAAPWTVSGDIPPRVLAAGIPVVSVGGTTHLRREDDGRIAVTGPVSPALRAALDGSGGVPVHLRPRPLPIPGRATWFGLLATSTLTGAIAGAISGERSQRTLGTLLAASVTRGEIVVGKWLAWGGLGVLASGIAATVAIALGRVPAGPWLVALPWAPLGTAAFGLWLVRGAGDPLSGTTASIRTIPALLGVVALAAWGLGWSWPLVGAAVPIGGALLAAGSTWGSGWGPPVVGAASSALASAALLAATAADLDETPPERSWPPLAAWAGWTAVAAAVSGVVVGFPALWAQIGDPAVLARFRPEMPAWTHAWLTVWLAAAAWAWGGATPPPTSSSPPRGALRATVAGLALGFAAPLTDAVALTTSPVAAGYRALLWTAPLAPTLLASVAEEALFRGYLQRRFGAAATVVAWTLARAPANPHVGIATGLLLAWAGVRDWRLSAAARVIACAVSLPLGPVGP